MADPSSTPAEAPPAHEGPHYINPQSKTLEVPVPKTDRAGTQRVVWQVFFVLLLCAIAMGVVLGVLTRQP